MIDREKVINALGICAGENDFSVCINEKCPYIGGSKDGYCITNLERDALALLKEQPQEAKTVESIQISRNFYAELTGYCPLCKRPLKSQFNKYFCGNCGQAVKWE